MKFIVKNIYTAIVVISAKTYDAIAQSPLGDADDLGIPRAKADSGTLDAVIEVLLYLGGALSIIFVIAGGLMYIFSAGNPDTAKKGRTTILYALIGLAVVVLAYAIIIFTTDFFEGEGIFRA